MGTGRIIRFDTDKGYGFIAQDNGGDDVFLHVNELLDVGSQVGTGTRLRFNVMDGARGLKAYGVQVIEGYHSGEDAAGGASTPRSNGTANANGTANGTTNGTAANGTAASPQTHPPASPANVAALVSNGTAVGATPEQAPAKTHESSDEETCEVFSEEEFTRRITELMLESAPQLTCAQLLELRAHLLEFARKHSWVD
jgi:CspA family cold shock protein